MANSKQRKKDKSHQSEQPVFQEQALAKTQQDYNIFSVATLVQGLSVLLLGFAIYFGTLKHEYAVDDALLITENTVTQKGLDGLKDIFTKDAFFGFFGEGYKNLVAGGRYRPLSMATFALEVEYFGKDSNAKPNLKKARIAHLVNVLLYALTGLLLYLTLLVLFKNYRPKHWFELNLPLIIALLYIAHPIHAEVVSNIKAREEIMGLFGSIAALFFAVRYVRTNNIALIVGVALSYAFAMFSKENSITFLAVVPLAMYVFAKPKLKHYIAVALPMLAMAGFYLYLRDKATGGDITLEVSEILNNPFAGSSKAEQIATSFYTFIEYWKLLIAPITLTHDYYFNQVPIVGPTNLQSIIALLVSAALVAYAIKEAVINKSGIAFAILYFFITFSVVSNILFTVGIAMNERFMFMPSLGFSIVCGILLIKGTNWLKDKNFGSLDVKSPAILGSILVIVLALYSFKTVDRSLDWKSDYTLFKADVKNSPNSAKIHNAYGGELFTLAQQMKKTDPKRKVFLEESVKVLNRAIKIYPRYKNAWLLLGNANYLLHDSLAEAVYYYNKVLEVAPGYYEGLFNLGAVYLEQNKPKDAAIYLQMAVNAKPEKYVAWYNLADAFDKAGEHEKAIATFIQAGQRFPNEADLYFKIGQVYGRKLNDLDNAISYFKKALEYRPNNLIYLEDLGVAFGMKQDFTMAIQIFEKMLTVDPNNLAALRNISITYKQIGNEQKAAEYIERAKKSQ